MRMHVGTTWGYDEYYSPASNLFRWTWHRSARYRYSISIDPDPIAMQLLTSASSDVDQAYSYVSLPACTPGPAFEFDHELARRCFSLVVSGSRVHHLCRPGVVQILNVYECTWLSKSREHCVGVVVESVDNVSVVRVDQEGVAEQNCNAGYSRYVGEVK